MLISSLHVLGSFSGIVALASAITPAKMPNGGVVDGYFGNWDRAYDGDLLVVTNCLCAKPPPVYESEADRANYLQYEYYNYHMNKTFFWDNICTTNHKNREGCLLPTSPTTLDGFYSYILKDSPKTWCRVWGGTSRGRSFDGAWAKLCIEFHILYDIDTAIIFNGQKRDLETFGRQRRVDVPRNETRRVCDAVCPEVAGMLRMEEDKIQRSVQSTFELDDMCKGCK